MDEALIGWLFFGVMLSWRWVSRFGSGRRQHGESCDRVPVQKKMRAVFGRLTPLFQWYTLTGLGLTYFMGRTMWDVVKYDYISAHLLGPAVIKSKIPDDIHVEIDYFPGYLRVMSLFAPLVGTVGFAISIWKSFRLVTYSLEFDSQGHRKSSRLGQGSPNANQHDSLLHRCDDQLLVVIGVPLVFIVFSLRALIRQWEVMTWSFCWHYWKANAVCPDEDTTRALVSDECKLDMYFAQAFQFYAMWEFSELCGHFMSDPRIRWVDSDSQQEKGDNKGIMKEYRRTINWAAALALYAFAGIGMLKSIFEFAMTVVLNVMPDRSTDVRDNMDVVQHKVDTVFAFATILCVINMLLISRMEPLKKALGANINLKFHGTRTMLLVLQVQPKVLDFFTVNPEKENGLAFLDQEEATLLNVTLVLYWCLVGSVVNAIVWEAPQSLEDTIGNVNDTARKIDEDHEKETKPLEASLLFESSK